MQRICRQAPTLNNRIIGGSVWIGYISVFDRNNAVMKGWWNTVLLYVVSKVAVGGRSIR